MLRRTFCLAGLALAPALVRAQADWARIAVPSYTPRHFVQGVWRHWSLPRSDEFVVRAAALAQALRALCEAPAVEAAAALDVARGRWLEAVASWERLSAVSVGPLLERRSARQIDFTPVRPALLERAVKAAPQGPQAMERIGAPAKGLPGLERLLWSHSLRPATPQCRYAVEVAADIEREAVALRQAFAQAAPRDWDDEVAEAAFGELVNQWVGGLERLRWAQIEKPLRAAADTGRAPELPRAASGGSAQAWAAQWQVLRALAVLAPGTAAPQPGAGLVPIETYLRGKGLNASADALARAVARADSAMDRLAAQDRPRLMAAAGELAALKRLAENELAADLRVSLGFSDADGD